MALAQATRRPDRADSFPALTAAAPVVLAALTALARMILTSSVRDLRDAAVLRLRCLADQEDILPGILPDTLPDMPPATLRGRAANMPVYSSSSGTADEGADGGAADCRKASRGPLSQVLLQGCAFMKSLHEVDEIRGQPEGL